MAEKTIKKTATKKTVSKQTKAKPVATKKVTPKKIPETPCVEMHECGCAHGCACHGHCGKKKCTFGRFIKKLIVFLIIFAMGFASAKLCIFDDCGQKKFRPVFENGCLVVKCPKMAEKIQQMDINNDGCVSREEFRMARRMFNKNKQNAPAPQPVEVPQPETVVTE